MAFAPRGPRTVPRVLVDEPDADYAGPRWSPDGRRIVAERRRAGLYELVLVDPDTGAVTPLLARGDARLVTPSWTKDGAAVLFAADAGDEPFNIYAVDVRSGHVGRVTDSASGAQSPELMPDGSLVYVGYTPAGYDLFSLPPAMFRATPDASFDGSRLQAGDRVAAEEKIDADEMSGLKAGAAYSPLRTLVPTYWEPVIESDSGETLVGAATAMTDALGRHAYGVQAMWSGSRGRPDWSVSYAYDRWRPTVVLSYSDDTDPTRSGQVRSRELLAGMLLPFRRIRWSQTLMAGFDAETQTVTCAVACPLLGARRDLRSIRGGWLYDSRRTFPYSISVEEGFAVEAAIDGSRRGLGSDGDATAAIFDARAFRRVGGTHAVLAVRLAAASGWGDAVARRVFSAAGPGPSAPSFDFGRDAIGLLRGFDPDDVVGPSAAVVNADLRVPLRRVQRGPGLWPVFVRSIHAAAFVDAGNVWNRAFRAADIRYAAGGEIATNVVIVHYVPLTIAGGVSWIHDPVARRDGAATFARLGYAF
jgi:hypothetical protein